MPLDLPGRSLVPSVFMAPMAGITDHSFCDLLAGSGTRLAVSKMAASQEMVQVRPGGRKGAEIEAGVEGPLAKLARRTPCRNAGALRCGTW